MSDALSCLSIAKFSIKTNLDNFETLDLKIYYSEITNSKFDQIYIYQDILVAITIEFKSRILDKYIKKKL